MNWSRVWALIIVLTICTTFWLAVFSSAGWTKTVQKPPARYDYEPTVPYEVRYYPEEFFPIKLPYGCGTSASNIWGCAMPWATPCLIIIRAELTPVQREATLHHEWAHCNGWHKSHPN